MHILLGVPWRHTRFYIGAEDCNLLRALLVQRWLQTYVLRLNDIELQLFLLALRTQ